MTNILKRWNITEQELTELIDENPSLRGVILGYLAEIKLRKIWFDKPEFTRIIKPDDHDRTKKGDLIITYKNHDFVIECKSLQTNSVKFKDDKYVGIIQCDASDRRKVYFSDDSSVETTLLKTGEFDILAACLFAFNNEWKFIFAKNKDLPHSQYKKYTKLQQQELIKANISVSNPPIHPFTDNLFLILDEIILERQSLTNLS